MKNVKFLGLFTLLILLINILESSQYQALAQTGGVEINISGQGCNSRVEFNPYTQIVTLKPSMKLTARKEVERIVCVVRISTPTDDQILVPFSIKGNTRTNGGNMNVAITTNSGAEVLSTLRRTYTRSGGIDAAHLFSPSESPQCGSSSMVGANINLHGTNGSIELSDIRFKLQTKKC
jgi:hypothetical protein